MLTNRELYSFVADLAARHRVGQRPLETYLRVMWGLARTQPDRAAWSLDEFAALLADSFVAPEPALEPTLADMLAAAPEPSSGFDRWQHAILIQIADLRAMADAGQLAHELRYYGIDATSGARWYNFDACSYLEAGAVGAFGGLLPEDDRAITIDWDDFARFLVAGASYE